MTAYLVVTDPPKDLFPDHPHAYFVTHTPSNRRMPATWTSRKSAQRFIDAAQDMADWSSPTAVLTKAISQAIEDHGGSWDSWGYPWLPAKPYKPTPVEVADVLDKALTVLDRVGWHQGDAYAFYDEQQEEEEDLAPSECRVCLEGAIHIAVEGQPTPPEMPREEALAEAAVAALRKQLNVKDVTLWNDEAGRTFDEVRDVAARTAAHLRAAA